MQAAIQANDMETYWQWEAKICEQEIEYYEGLLRSLKAEVDQEIAERLEAAKLEDVSPKMTKKQMTTE